jgi:hypothetical protein
MFSFGSDPELFLSKNGELKSAIGVLPDKEHKIKVRDNSYYYDNVLVELQIKPSTSKYDAVNNFRSAFEDIAEDLEGYELKAESANWFPKKELCHKQSRIAGCNPEYCAYTLQQVMPPQEIIETTGFRTAGGHIHLGNNDIFNDGMQTLNLVRMLDLFLGIPSILLDHDINQVYRRKIYGHAGSHRIPEHGLEYRCLGNFWIKSPKLVELVYDITSFTIDFVENNEHEKFWSINDSQSEDDDISLAHNCFGYDVKLLQNSINCCKKKEAETFMNIVSCYLPNNLVQQITELQNVDFDFYKEWNI